MDFAGFIEEPIYNEDGNVAYYQYTMTWKENS